jgi:predicted double-glycine peptidase
MGLACALGLAAGCAAAPRLQDAPFAPSADGLARVLAAPAVAQASGDGCGGAALATVLGYWGAPVAPGDPLVSAAPASGGLSAGELAAIARGRGLGATCFAGVVADLTAQVERGRPVLVLLPVNDGRLHWCVVAGHDPASGDFVFADPARGWRRASRAAFDAAWAAAGRCALLVAPTAPPAPADALAVALPADGGTPAAEPVSGAEWAALAARAVPGLEHRRGGETVTIDFRDPDFWWGAGLFGGGVFVVMLIIVIVVA